MARERKKPAASEPPQPTPPSAPPEKPGKAGPSGHPVFEAFLFDLDAGFTAELERWQTRLLAARETANQELLKAGGELAKSREKLARAFAEAEEASPLDEQVLRRLAREIDGQLTWIFRRVRPEVDRQLRPLAPRKKPVLGLLLRTAELYARTAAKLPDEIPGTPAGAAPEAAEEAEASAPPARPKTVADLAERYLKPQTERLRRLAEEHLQLTPRKLVAEILAARPDPRRHPLVRQYQETYEGNLSRLADAWRGVRFHLEVAADDLEALAAGMAGGKAMAEPAGAKMAEAKNLVLEVLADAETKLAACLGPLNAWLEGLPESLLLEHRDFVQDLRRELQGVESWGKVSRHTLRGVLRRVKGVWERGRTLVEQGREEVARSAGTGIAQTENLLRNLQGLLGKGGKTQETLLTLTDLPAKAQVLEKVGRLPHLYRRLFTLGPLKNREFLVAREEELEELDNILQRWQSGRTCSVALVGPEGSGKTSLLNCFENLVGGQAEILRTEIRDRLRSEDDLLRFFRAWLQAGEEIASTADLIEHIRSGPRRILIVEGGHHLGLRVIGGYQTARLFLHVMMSTRRHCLWLLTCRQYAWSRLDHQLGIGQYFTHQVRTLFHDETEIREAMLLRHRTSGLPLVFLGEEGEEASGGGQEELAERFYRDLFEASSGNIEAAIYFWLLGLAYDEQKKALTASPLGRPDYGFLRALGRDYLFALAEVVSHGGLSVTEYCAIFRREELEGRMTLDYLAHLNLLVTAETGEQPRRYSLNPVFFGPITRTLESMNILY